MFNALLTTEPTTREVKGAIPNQNPVSAPKQGALKITLPTPGQGKSRTASPRGKRSCAFSGRQTLRSEIGEAATNWRRGCTTTSTPCSPRPRESPRALPLAQRSRKTADTTPTPRVPSKKVFDFRTVQAAADPWKLFQNTLATGKLLTRESWDMADSFALKHHPEPEKRRCGERLSHDEPHNRLNVPAPRQNESRESSPRKCAFSGRQQLRSELGKAARSWRRGSTPFSSSPTTTCSTPVSRKVVGLPSRRKGSRPHEKRVGTSVPQKTARSDLRFGSLHRRRCGQNKTP